MLLVYINQPINTIYFYFKFMDTSADIPENKYQYQKKHVLITYYKHIYIMNFYKSFAPSKFSKVVYTQAV